MKLNLDLNQILYATQSLGMAWYLDVFERRLVHCLFPVKHINLIKYSKCILGKECSQTFSREYKYNFKCIRDKQNLQITLINLNLISDNNYFN